MAKKSDVLVSELYPIISTKIQKNNNKFKQVIAKSFEKRAKNLYDICPCDRLVFGGQDLDDFYEAIGISESEIRVPLSKTYYWDVANFNPQAAKDEFTVAMIMIIRHFYIKNMKSDLELATIYLAFSGKFYPSIHYGSFPKVSPSEYRHIMEYVVNNRLNERFDLKSEGSVFKAIKSICVTWLNTYGNKIKSCDDDDVVYIIQQLHNRIKSFMKNIAEIYYEVYNNKESYLVYDSDNLSEDNYHIADNDSLRIERVVEQTMNYINNTSVDYKLCRMASDSNVRTDEVKSIIETILNDNTNISICKELIRIIVTEYFMVSKTKDVRDRDFIVKSITPKPNSKNANIIRQREIVENWLMDGSPSYRKRRSREATKSSYHKSIITYFTLLINEANK